LGVLDDGRWWDTLLITWGLLECDENNDKLKHVISHMFDKGVQKNGGIAYGLEFEYAPDTDDTGVLALILAKYYKKEYASSLKLTNEWLISMQNSDGGFGAFARNNYSWGVVRLFAGNFQNSAEIFDASSVDVTAHILEGWAESGYSSSENHVKKAIAYIKAQQTEFGAWEGRWGCNYIYAVSSVISAITKFPDITLKNEPWLIKSIKWLLSCQNQDGGFGESKQIFFKKSLVNPKKL
jgi:squalene-hopene/tetraprenyl-beta-curcumene cyclase